MAIKRRIHAGHVYLGKSILRALDIRDGDEVEIEVRGREIIIRPVKTIDKYTLNLIKILEESKSYGGREDYFKEYDYEDTGE